MPRYALSLTEFLKTNFPRPEPLIDGLLGLSEFAILTATAKTGKTWLSIHLALSVARGTPFLGAFQTKKAKVLIVQAELSHGLFKERLVTALNGAGAEMEELDAYLSIAMDRQSIDSEDGWDKFWRLVDSERPDLLMRLSA